MKIKVKIGDDTHEVERDALEFPDNQVLIDKENPPNGFFTQAALDEKIQQRLTKESTKVKSTLKEDKEFHSEILSQYNISLDEDGKPKGLKPDFDPQDWIQKKSGEITKPLKEQIEKLETRYGRTKKARIEDAILAATKGLYKEELTKPKDEGRVKPIVVNQFRDLFDENDDGIIALKEGDHFAVDNSTGKPITPDKYLTNQEIFGDYMVDKRQRSSGFQNGANGGKPVFTEKEIGKMSDEEFEKNLPAIQKAQAEGRIQ